MPKIIRRGPNGKRFVILYDTVDKELVDSMPWIVNHYGYATTTQPDNVNNILRPKMHRLIMVSPKGFQVDHINGNRLDNRRSNLRLCTSSQNNFNRKVIRSNTGFKGVSHDARCDRYYSRIMLNRKSIPLGRFSSLIEAAEAYNKAAQTLFGEFASINVIPRKRVAASQPNSSSQQTGRKG